MQLATSPNNQIGANINPVYAIRLCFEAETLDGQTLQMKLHNIGKTYTADDLFYYETERAEPVACRYSSLRVMTDEQIFEAWLASAG